MNAFYDSRFWRIALLLLATVAVVYGSAAGNAFVAYDDDRYVYKNPVVTNGLSVDGIKSAFTRQKFSAWYPVTTISHVLAWELFGESPAGHHLVNVALHGANAVLLLALIVGLTGQIWLGAAIAMCFAVHPLHVESVAWVTERKDVLSGFFALFALLAYLRYSARPNFLNYTIVFLLFALGLLSKSMLVTLPLLFLLLDFWLRERTQQKRRTSKSKRQQQQTPPTRSIQHLLIEKIPLLLLSLIFCITTYRAHLDSIAEANPTAIPLIWRILNAPVSYVSYLAKGIWPSDLACFYPHPGLVAPETLNEYWLKAGIACALLLVVTALAVIWRRSRPWLLVGWAWYLGMLLPVLGVVQVGQAALADRFTYLPFIGIYLILASAGMELAERLPAWRRALGAAACAILAIWGALAWQQVGVWKDSHRLFTHALEVTDRNALVHNNFGVVLFEAGEFDRAIAHFHAAISIDRSLPDYHDNLGFLWARRGDMHRAMKEFRSALAISPADFNANYHMGEALFRLQNYRGAIKHLERALAARPGHAEARNFLEKARKLQRDRR